jgi:hypothetical protein
MQMTPITSCTQGLANGELAARVEWVTLPHPLLRNAVAMALIDN